MYLKKITAIMIGAVMAVSMAVPAMADDKVETVTDGKLTVATSPDFAPYEFYSIDEDGNPTLSGFDMDLAQYIADKMGLELEVVPMDFDGVLSELSQKNVDLGMAGLSPDPARADAMEFSDLYYKGGQSFVTVKDKADQFKTLEDANNKDTPSEHRPVLSSLTLQMKILRMQTSYLCRRLQTLSQSFLQVKWMVHLLRQQ